MTELEKAIVMVIDVFDKYASKEGSNASLSKGEMKSLLEKELPGMLKSSKDKDASDKLLKELDEDGDSEVDFKEYVIFVATLATMAHKCIKGCAPKK
ncbi:protein S100-P-like [Bombina bombina]|uniref:protein S100-P-like n=1 Tax=Bombina bombina TaxID=8345 RepID=UPI00235A9947|nr:protein S100-P-like [Bombina bombina]